MAGYILGIDQSTSGTKAILFDATGAVAGRHDVSHKQWVNDKGWVEHDPAEIIANLYKAVAGVLADTGIGGGEILAAGISNQRETGIVWDRSTGEPAFNAIVWQCPRGEDICQEIMASGAGDSIRRSTGIPVSPYYSAAKFAWVVRNAPKAKELAASGKVCCSTVDSWVVYQLCGGEPRTDYSNASRTQLFNVSTLAWDPEVCRHFGLDAAWLPQVMDSNALYGYSDFNGILPKPVPVHGVMGDSHGALYGQNCLTPGSVKATYGTGSSVMMNIGDKPLFSDKGVVTSLAWGIDGKATYVFEGNLNYTGAVIRWLVEDVKLLGASKEAGGLAARARDIPGLYLVPAFSGLGAPYWDGKARGVLCGLDRAVGKNEIVRAAEECIGYQIADILRIMQQDTGLDIPELRVDGGASGDAFLMQFQADIVDAAVVVPAFEELSGSGPAYLAGMAVGLYKSQPERKVKQTYRPAMSGDDRERRIKGWLDAVGMVLTKK